VRGPGEEPPAVVRLGPATTLPADQLPRLVELDLGKGVTMRFALIPAGRFLMGSPPGEGGREDDEVQHEVAISRPFYMAVTKVTQEQYEALAQKCPLPAGQQILTGAALCECHVPVREENEL